MPTGLLEVTGSLDVSQFWPQGSSDADTTKILVNVSANSFRFRPSPTDPFQVTHAFDNAIVVGKTRKPAIDKNDRITVRLQGIDAPELHYRPTALLKKNAQSATQHSLYLQWNLDYRQRYAETGTLALKNALSGGANPMACTVVSAVDSPDDVFDTYGRLVGDIVVQVNGSTININQWLLQNGWAAPTFYASMTPAEISTLTQLTALARSNHTGMWPDFTRKIVAFDWNRIFRKGGPPNPQQDAGPVMLAKMFRRQSTYAVNKKSKMFTGSLLKYLQKTPDDLHLTSEFLSQGPAAAPVRYLHQMLVNNRLTVDPEEIVFREKPSHLISPGGGSVSW